MESEFLEINYKTGFVDNGTYSNRFLQKKTFHLESVKNKLKSWPLWKI